jgi:hypothetical protein
MKARQALKGALTAFFLASLASCFWFSQEPEMMSSPLGAVQIVQVEISRARPEIADTTVDKFKRAMHEELLGLDMRGIPVILKLSIDHAVVVTDRTRFWVGTTAGADWMEVSAEVINLRTNEQIRRYTVKRLNNPGAMALVYDQEKSLILDVTTELVDQIAGRKK